MNHKITGEVLETYLRPLVRERIDTLILGCTHYPLLKAAIRKVVGPKVALVDSGEACAHFVRDRLHKLKLLTTRKRKGVIQPFVTDETDRFELVAKRFLKSPTEPPWKIDLAF